MTDRGHEATGSSDARIDGGDDRTDRSDGSADRGEDAIVRRSLDTDAEEPAAQIATAVAELEGTDPAELASMWECTDDVLEHVFSDPPAPEAGLRVSFSYEGYRITVDQDGQAEFVATDAA